MIFTLSTTVDTPYGVAVAASRRALVEQGFVILTEMDLKATLKEKLGVDVAPQVVFGACRPQVAHQVLSIDPSIAAVLPCSVVVRSVDERTTSVEAFVPDAMARLAGDAFCDVAADARQRLDAVLVTLGGDR